MISLQELESFDWLQWLGTGELAARQLCCNQATVSRHAQHVQKILGVRLERHSDGSYGPTGNNRLLRLERQVHQLARTLGRRPMRLHLMTGKGYLTRGLPQGWCCNPPSRLEAQVDGAALLADYVLDACIMQRPQVAGLDPQSFCAIELFSSPLYLVLNGSHTLSHDKGITAADLASSTQLIHLNGLPLATRQATEQLHARLLGEQMLVAAQSEKAEDLSNPPIQAKIYYVHALGLGQQDHVPIDFDVNYTTRDYVVFLRENMETPGIQLLLDELRSSLQATAARLPQLSCAL
jgi:DNA-binding transcriptional LysR family regulator